MTDDDLPYIPGEEEPYSPVDEDVPSLSDTIHQQMEELSRKIEKEKLAIEMMTAGSQSTIVNDDVSISYNASFREVLKCKCIVIFLL